MAFLDTLKSGWDKVKSLWNDLTWNTTKTTATTPTTTTPTTPTDTTTSSPVISNLWTAVPNVQSAETLNQLVSWQDNTTTQPNDEYVSTPSEYYDYDALDEQKVRKKLAEREEEDDESFWDWLQSKANAIWNGIQSIFNSKAIETQYNRDKKIVSVWYNQDTGDVYSLELWWDYYDKNGNVIDSNTAFWDAVQDYVKKITELWDNITYEDYDQAYRELYDKTKWMFKIKAQDYYQSNDGRFKRRKDSFTQEELNDLAKTWVKEWSTPTYEQFQAYMQTVLDNENIMNDLKEKYSSDDEWLDIDNSQKSRFMWVFMNKAMDWIMDVAKNNLYPEEVQTYIAQAYSIAQDRWEEARKNSKWTFEAAAVIREKVKQGKAITEEERQVLEAANKLDDALNTVANAFNFIFKDTANTDYVKDWKIYEARDLFSDWRTLWQVLSQPTLEALWIEWWENTSWLDWIIRTNNDALYHYEHSAWGLFWNRWEEAQHVIWKSWDYLSEFWQQTFYWLAQAVNYATDFFTADFDSLNDRIGWKKAWTKWWEYMNQDFSVWMLINTEETWFWSMFWQDWSRTIRKYLAQASEYTPEFVWNVIPDIILVLASWWWAAPLVAGTKIASAANYLKKWVDAVKWLKMLNALKWASKIKQWIWWLRWVEEAANVLSKSTKVPSSLRYMGERAAKLIKDWIVDQAIDAQWNYYDTEAYSDVSFGLSIWWTALFEVLWNLINTWVFKVLKNWLSWDYLKKGTAWDAIEFFWREENRGILDEYAKRMGKNGTLSYDDYKRIASNMDDLGTLLNKSWDSLPDSMKPSANKWTKEMAYRIMNQVLDLNANSMLWKNIRAIISKEWTTVADLYKYITWISWDVKIWPWTSVIKLKNADWTARTLLWVEWWANMPWYNQKLDMVIDWWLSKKLSKWFDLKDIEAIKSLPEYSWVTNDMFTLGKDWKYFITDDWVKALWISTIDMPLEFQAKELAKEEAWTVAEKFKEIMKWLRTGRKNISDRTIDEIANSGAYQDVREKVADIVCK